MINNEQEPEQASEQASEPVNRVLMTSSCIEWAEYDSFTLALNIKFHSGPTVYSFAQFPKPKWKLFLAAPSKGKFYHQHIEGRYQRV